MASIFGGAPGYGCFPYAWGGGGIWIVWLVLIVVLAFAFVPFGFWW